MSDETPKTRLQKLRLERDVKFDEIVSSKVFDWRAITGTDPPNINRIDRGVDPAFAEIPADDGAAGTKRRAGNRDLFADLDAAIDSEEIFTVRPISRTNCHSRCLRTNFCSRRLPSHALWLRWKLPIIDQSSGSDLPIKQSCDLIFDFP